MSSLEDNDEQFGSATADEAQAGKTATTHWESGIERRMSEQQAYDQQTSQWREEIASRVEGYKQKRARKRLSGEFSMRFDFEPAYRSRGTQAAAAAAPAYEEPLDLQVGVAQAEVEYADPADAADVEQYAGAASVQVPEATGPLESGVEEPVYEAPAYVAEPVAPEPLPKPAARERRRRHPNLIEFPRLFSHFVSPDELAEPVLDRPRILDVPDEIVQDVVGGAPPLGDLKLEAEEEEPVVATNLEVPLQVAPMSTRVTAALVDSLVVAGGLAVFMAVAQALSPGLPHNRMTLAVALIAPCVLWATYQFIFLVYGAATMGMRTAKLEIRGFDGNDADRGGRRARALCMILSYMPLGLGLAWALADEDILCWHDRMSRTYLARS